MKNTKKNAAQHTFNTIHERMQVVHNIVNQFRSMTGISPVRDNSNRKKFKKHVQISLSILYLHATKLVLFPHVVHALLSV